MNYSFVPPTIDHSNIIGIQFSILSPQQIRTSSACEITSKDTYINGNPVLGGLFDPRMGVLEPGIICPTDGYDYMKTPGYHGHMELASPVYSIQFLNTVINIMKCVCFKCSKLLINKETFRHLSNIPNDKKWKIILENAKDVVRCGSEIDDGCGTLQPKISKEELATVLAEWKDPETSEKIIIKITPSMAIKILRRISDEDVAFMGFSPIFSRPEWMITEVLLVPPPTIRPSVKQDGQQRSEDDLTHILVNIFKTNKTLQDKINSGAPLNIIEDWETLLQYFIASMINNKIPKISQRSGRQFKSIRDRLNAKTGRMRGNLMAKRVNFSARSVITADPNISIGDLGVPLVIAKNITKPIMVNKINKQYLRKLVINGADVWPGAKILEKKNGESITLRYYAHRESLVLDEGDIVHAHMNDGDLFIFNRQPTLHRMSMMGHRAKIMKKGNTFRMNVAVTKPYNADFDGDEMNLHMPQGLEAEAELAELASVKYQIVSPANNSTIIGIYQDSMLGAYQFTRPNIYFTPRDAMNLLIRINTVNESELMKCINKDGLISNYDVLSQIFPPLSMYLPKVNKDGSKNILNITNGKYISGQIDKSVVGSTSKGLLHRICNDFGNAQCVSFIDDLQNIITEYMKMSSFSVGIKDLIISETLTNSIIDTITNRKVDVDNLIQSTRLGVFDNNTGKSTIDEFEAQVNNILNKAMSESSKIGINGVDKDNRFGIMVNAGSKGSTLNLSQMIACLGQQNVDGKRIPYGFDNRTLPHFCKFDDSPQARGFVTNSYISGLTPHEVFFHAMGGRIGLIDTAVKTSTTGYIQRRLIKGLEDCMVRYDMTVRTSNDSIVQFTYGDDSFDTVKVENQSLPIATMTMQEIYSHYIIPKDAAIVDDMTRIFLKDVHGRMVSSNAQYMEKMQHYIDFMATSRDRLVQYVFNGANDTSVNMPVSFYHIINNVRGQCGINQLSMVDITPLECIEFVEYYYSKLEIMANVKPTELFRMLYYYYLSPISLLVIKRFNRAALVMLLEIIVLKYKSAIVAPGEMVGMIAGQSIGEISTQMTLNTFHFAGVASKSNVTRGVPRIEEILNLIVNLKNPSVVIYLKQEDQASREKAQSIMHMIEELSLKDIVKSIEIWYDPNDTNTIVEEDKQLLKNYQQFSNLVNACAGGIDQEEDDVASKWVSRLELKKDVMLEKNITMDDVEYAIMKCHGQTVQCIYSDFNSNKLIFRIRLSKLFEMGKNMGSDEFDQTDNLYKLQLFQENLINSIILRGVKNIPHANLRKVVNTMVKHDDVYKPENIWVVDTLGTNLMDILSLEFIDASRTISNDIVEVCDIFGIQAARQVIYNELVEVIEFDGTSVNYHHYSIIVDRMTFTGELIPFNRHGLNNDDTGPIAKASFEETPEMFIRAARHGEMDTMRGVSANVMCGQQGLFGTSSFNVLLDSDKYISQMQTAKQAQPDEDEDDAAINEFYRTDTTDVQNMCDIDNIIIHNNVESLQYKSTGDVDDDYDMHF